MTASPPSLLVVDDEPDTCANLSDIFTDLGYHVDVAYDGPGALELIDRQTYDVALLDLKMPGMSGLELYRRIRKVSAGTIAIVVTAYAASDTAKAVTEAGAWKIVPKPVDLPQLHKLVDEALEKPLVLVVDDDQDLCDSLWDIFREQGLRVYLAHDANSAAQRLAEREYRVVLIDMKLPEGHGGEVLRRVQQANPDARAILITGHRSEMDERVRKALQSGADAICYKPFDMDQLLETVLRLATTKGHGEHTSGNHPDR
jgi:DNA-binding NtrC family response regulator